MSSNKGECALLCKPNRVIILLILNILFNIFYLSCLSKINFEKMRESNINSTFACLKTVCDNEQMPPGHRKECELQNIWRWKEPGDV